MIRFLWLSEALKQTFTLVTAENCIVTSILRISSCDCNIRGFFTVELLTALLSQVVAGAMLYMQVRIASSKASFLLFLKSSFFLTTAVPYFCATAHFKHKVFTFQVVFVFYNENSRGTFRTHIMHNRGPELHGFS